MESATCKLHIQLARHRAGTVCRDTAAHCRYDSVERKSFFLNIGGGKETTVIKVNRVWDQDFQGVDLISGCLVKPTKSHSCYKNISTNSTMRYHIIISFLNVSVCCPRAVSLTKTFPLIMSESHFQAGLFLTTNLSVVRAIFVHERAPRRSRICPIHRYHYIDLQCLTSK